MLPLHHLLYTSLAARPIGPQALDDIARTSACNNVIDGIHGRLFAMPAGFVQYLEGTRAALDSLYERLLADPRHRDLVIHSLGPLDGFTNPDWDDRIRWLQGDPDAAEARLLHDLPMLDRRLVRDMVSRLGGGEAMVDADCDVTEAGARR